MTGGWVIAILGGAPTGAAIAREMTSVGLGQVNSPPQPQLCVRSAVAGGVVGAVAISIAYRADQWALVPALIIWGCALVAAGSCDAVTKRVPTPLIRQATVAMTALLVVGLGVQGDWRALALSGVAALAAGASMLVCWRYATAGFGDVRLAILGGLGLGHASGPGLLLGFAAFAIVVVVQTGLVFARGCDRSEQIPLGPALVSGFLLAATL